MGCGSRADKIVYNQLNSNCIKANNIHQNITCLAYVIWMDRFCVWQHNKQIIVSIICPQHTRTHTEHRPLGTVRASTVHLGRDKERREAGGRWGLQDTEEPAGRVPGNWWREHSYQTELNSNLLLFSQKHDGKPIFLKRGTTDQILYRLTMAGCVVGIAGIVQVIYQLA